MKKLIFSLIIFLIILSSILGIYIYLLSKPSADNTSADMVLREDILKNSSWTNITEEDLNGYLNGTYTQTTRKIINSLEEATPVIFCISDTRFDSSENDTFIVASAFNTSNQVYVYYYNKEEQQYAKVLSSFETLLRNSHSVYIYNRLEVTE